MCLAVPGMIERVDAEDINPRMADVNFGGVKRQVCIDFLPDVKIGEYVIVHVGFALEKINKEEAEEQLKIFAEAEDIIRSRMK
jgi:hydrogenase expression/formation protein HypC